MSSLIELIVVNGADGQAVYVNGKLHRYNFQEQIYLTDLRDILAMEVKDTNRDTFPKNLKDIKKFN